MSPPCDPAYGGASLCLRWPGLPRAPVPCKTLDTVLTAGRQESEPSATSPASGAPGQERAATRSFPRGRSPAPAPSGTTTPRDHSAGSGGRTEAFPQGGPDGPRARPLGARGGPQHRSSLVLAPRIL